MITFGRWLRKGHSGHSTVASVTPLPARPTPGVSAVVGASYLSALCADDTDMLDCLLDAFDASELLEVVAGQALTLARRVAMAEGVGMQEFCDRLIGAAQVLQQARLA